MDTESIVAWHEAGHVAAYHFFGKEFEHISIVAQENGLGRCIPFPADRPGAWDEETLTQGMIVAGAGVAAEALWLLLGQTRNWLAEQDVHFFYTAYYRFAPGSIADKQRLTARWVQKCWLESQKIVAAYAPSIERVAEDLIKRKELTGAEAVALINVTIDE